MRLNDKYYQLLSKPLKKLEQYVDEAFSIITETFDMEYAENIRDLCPIYCCGISELRFYALFSALENRSQEKKELMIAHYINRFGRSDERVLIAGLVTATCYSAPKYRELLPILLSFGFVQLGEPYINKGSGNEITVVAAQRQPQP